MLKSEKYSRCRRRLEDKRCINFVFQCHELMLKETGGRDWRWCLEMTRGYVENTKSITRTIRTYSDEEAAKMCYTWVETVQNVQDRLLDIHIPTKIANIFRDCTRTASCNFSECKVKNALITDSSYSWLSLRESFRKCWSITHRKYLCWLLSKDSMKISTAFLFYVRKLSIWKHSCRRRGKGDLGIHWVLKFDILRLSFQQKRLFFSFECVKWNFTTFGP